MDARAIAAAAASAREAASGKAVEIPREADRVSLTAGVPGMRPRRQLRRACPTRARFNQCGLTCVLRRKRTRDQRIAIRSTTEDFLAETGGRDDDAARDAQFAGKFHFSRNTEPLGRASTRARDGHRANPGGVTLQMVQKTRSGANPRGYAQKARAWGGFPARERRRKKGTRTSPKKNEPAASYLRKPARVASCVTLSLFAALETSAGTTKGRRPDALRPTRPCGVLQTMTSVTTSGRLRCEKSRGLGRT